MNDLTNDELKSKLLIAQSSYDAALHRLHEFTDCFYGDDGAICAEYIEKRYIQEEREELEKEFLVAMSNLHVCKLNLKKME